MLKNPNYSRRVGHKVPGVVAVLCVHGQVQVGDIPGMGHKVICVYFAGQIELSGQFVFKSDQSVSQ